MSTQEDEASELLCAFCEDNPVFRLLSLRDSKRNLIEEVGLCEGCWIEGGYRQNWAGIYDKESEQLIEARDVSESVQNVLMDAMEEFGKEISARVIKRLDALRDEQTKHLRDRLRKSKKP